MSLTALARSVGRVGTTSKQVMSHGSPGFHMYNLHGMDLRMDPILGVDRFSMGVPFFPPHPHAGFSAVTYIFPESEGGFLNTDSLGDRSIIQPGDMHWTQAGRGMMHEEFPNVPGKASLGLQIFVNLPADKKLLPPKAMHLSARDVPVYTTPGGVAARVLVGECNGVRSPLDVATAVTILDVKLPPGATFELALPRTHNVMGMVIQGGVLAGPGGRQQLLSDQVFDLEHDADTVRLQGAGPEPAQVVLFAGRPLNQPSVWRGPFNGVSQEQVAGFVQAYQAGHMGRLASSVVT